ncbi:MAG: hypothetical protein QMD12_03045 [Candidatus Aenigmarchaeota archaeon]|nr:hypothetical protein [Candidatus Aenigmarchaeota archaeon]
MISVFLSKLLTSRQANFTDENISIFDLFFTMQPIESLVELQRSIEKQYERKGLEIMLNFGKNISHTIISHFKKRFDMKGDQLKNVWLNMFSLSGFGKLELVKLESNSAVFQTDSSTIAKIYLSKYKQQKQPVCTIICGMLESYMKEITGKKYCVFELTF